MTPQPPKSPSHLCCPHSSVELSLLLLVCPTTTCICPFTSGFWAESVWSRGGRQAGRAHGDGHVSYEDYITSRLPGSSPSQPGALLLSLSLPYLQRSLPSVSHLAFSLLSLQHAELRVNNRAFSAGCGQKGTE